MPRLPILTPDELKEMRENLIKIQSLSIRIDVLNLLDKIDQQNEDINKLKKGILAVKNLIGESSGVYGLHLNGGLAPWSDLLIGGRYEEWLVDFEEAVSI